MKYRPLAERFAEKYRINPATGCWDWIASKQRAYGQIGAERDSRPLLAHRVSYELHRGPIPKHLQVDHMCRNRGCVNPQHLRLLTRKENILCGASPTVKNAFATECIHGHKFDEKNTYITKQGWRTCRMCQAIFQRKLRARSKLTTPLYADA